jgi:hypothetical protein
MVIFFILLPILFDDRVTGDAQRCAFPDAASSQPTVADRTLIEKAIPAWDSVGSVQLVAELQAACAVDFDIEEIESPRSYHAISTVLRRKGISVCARS